MGEGKLFIVETVDGGLYIFNVNSQRYPGTDTDFTDNSTHIELN